MSGKMTRLFSVIILAIIFIALVLPLNTNVSRSENVTINYSFEKSQTSLYIVASMPSIAIIVKDIVGNTCTVDSILPEAIDPHSYQLTPSDVDKNCCIIRPQVNTFPLNIYVQLPNIVTCVPCPRPCSSKSLLLALSLNNLERFPFLQDVNLAAQTEALYPDVSSSSVPA